jgi:hypothetical protein
MNSLSFRTSPMRVAGVLVSVFIGSIVPTADAKAACEICAGRVWKYCQHVALGATFCEAWETDCVLSGGGCGIARTTGGKSASCTGPSQAKPQQRTLVASLADRPGTPAAPGERTGSIDGPTPLELEKLEKLKERVANNASKGLMSSGPVDYVKLFQLEPRDDAWAPQAESDIARALSSLPLAETGLSRPAVRCATSVCEIAVVQTASGSDNTSTNWQTQFIELANSGKLGLAAIDTAILVTDVGNDKTGFVSYVFVDREQPR